MYYIREIKYQEPSTKNLFQVLITLKHNCEQGLSEKHFFERMEYEHGNSSKILQNEMSYAVNIKRYLSKNINSYDIYINRKCFTYFSTIRSFGLWHKKSS